MSLCSKGKILGKQHASENPIKWHMSRRLAAAATMASGIVSAGRERDGWQRRRYLLTKPKRKRRSDVPFLHEAAWYDRTLVTTIAWTIAEEPVSDGHGCVRRVRDLDEGRPSVGVAFRGTLRGRGMKRVATSAGVRTDAKDPSTRLSQIWQDRAPHHTNRLGLSCHRVKQLLLLPIIFTGIEELDLTTIPHPHLPPPETPSMLLHTP